MQAMSQVNTQHNQIVDHFFRHEYAKVIAHLCRVYGTDKLELIEDAMQEALVKAMNIWPYKGYPQNPSGWLMTVARNQIIDELRRKQNFQQKESRIIKNTKNTYYQNDDVNNEEITDDLLGMIFACCHPILGQETQIVITLKLVCGLSVNEIAKALLKNEDTIRKGITRAKAKIKKEKVNFDIPTGNDLNNRLSATLKILYLLFNEGYNATEGDHLIKNDLCVDALRLAQLLLENKHCNKPEVHALLALMFFQASRFKARISKEGELTTLDKQNRNLWNQDLIKQGDWHITEASNGIQLTEYHIQAGIAYYHCKAKDYSSTDWNNILLLYNLQVKYYPSPIASLNRVVAFSEVYGPKKALEELKQLDKNTSLQNYRFYYAIKGDLYLKIEDKKQALIYLKKALKLTHNSIEIKYLEKRISNL